MFESSSSDANSCGYVSRFLLVETGEIDLLAARPGSLVAVIRAFVVLG
jgi:hypothetical protein